jgi:hypothetical protein
MPGTRKTATKKPAAKKAVVAKKKGAPRGPREPIVTPDKATFDTDDKRAQYARLIIFNFAKSRDSKAKVPSGADVNSVSAAVLTAAGKEFVNGNMIKGADGLDLIMQYSKDGSTTGRPLTKAYAAEVRPFLKRLKLAPAFGRRGGTRTKKEVAAEETAAENGGEAAETAEVEAVAAE